MRILLANDTVRGGGGIDSVVAMERRCLRVAGHEVIDYEVQNADFDEAPLRRRLALLASTLYGVRVRRDVERILEAEGIDLVHVHNTVPFLTGSIFDACRAAGVPVVASLHNFRAFCLSAYAFRDGRACRLCFPRVPWHSVVHGCYRGSRLQSLGLLAARTIDRIHGRPFGVDADAYVAVSSFLRDAHRAEGFGGEPIHVVPNAAPDPFPALLPGREPAAAPAPKLVYVGSLLADKGIFSLCDVASRLPEVAVHVIGDGEDRPALERAVAERDLRNVTLHGRQGAESRSRLWLDALFTLIPSRCPEAFPMVAVESLALGVPILASGVGGLVESVRHGEDGFQVDFEDPESFVVRVRQALEHPGQHAAMRSAARRVYEAEYAEADYAEKLLAVFEQTRREFGSATYPTCAKSHTLGSLGSAASDS